MLQVQEDADAWPPTEQDHLQPVVGDGAARLQQVVGVHLVHAPRLARRHPSWTHMYLMMMLAQVGFALAYVF